MRKWKSVKCTDKTNFNFFFTMVYNWVFLQDRIPMCGSNKEYTSTKRTRDTVLFKMTSCSFTNQEYLISSQGEMPEVKNWSSGLDEVWGVPVSEYCLNIRTSTKLCENFSHLENVCMRLGEINLWDRLEFWERVWVLCKLTFKKFTKNRYKNSVKGKDWCYSSQHFLDLFL